MQQNEKYIDPTSFDISIEEFDALEGTHEFSGEYKKKKRKMLKEYKRSAILPKKHIYAKVAVAAALITVSAPIIANAATDGEFFNRIWGSLAKKNVQSHKEILYNEQELPYAYTFPQREYVDVDPNKAEELIGSHISHEQIVKKLGNTTFTILSTVQDGNAAIVEFTLEQKDGVNALEYSQLDNELHGAEFSHDASFWFHFPSCSENILVDLEQSTKEVLHCYNYMTMEENSYDKEAGGIPLEINEYPCTRGELFEADEETFNRYKKETKISNITVPFHAPAKTAEYVNANGGIADISPLSVKIDMDTGLGLEELNRECYNTENIYYTSVNYKDGTSYLVQEHELEKIHSCDTKIDNTCCISCDTQGNIIFVFNRLVDTDAIASITVNEVTYTLKS